MENAEKKGSVKILCPHCGKAELEINCRIVSSFDGAGKPAEKIQFIFEVGEPVKCSACGNSIFISSALPVASLFFRTTRRA